MRRNGYFSNLYRIRAHKGKGGGGHVIFTGRKS
jgi:hypothetical protein